MQKHTKNFLKHYKIGLDEWFPCQYCGQAQAVDLHHIVGRGMGKSSDDLDNIRNLIGLCRSCHLRAEKREEPYIEREELQEIVNNIIDNI